MTVPPGAAMTFYVPFVRTAMSGIGHLTLSSEILNRHDAMYSLRSEEISEGWRTTFRIRFQS